MWQWTSSNKDAARFENEDGTYAVCGINCEPLASWLAEGNEPEEWSAE